MILQLSKINLFLIVLLIIGGSIISYLFLFHQKNNKLSSEFIRGGWCWFQDPRVVRFVGEHDRTYIGCTYTGKIMISYYDHELNEECTPYIVYETGQDDDHIAPSILILPTGHLLIFWSKHCGDHIHLRRCINPEDISRWEREQVISGSDNNCCYTYPIYFGKGRIYLFYRNCTNRNIKWIYSDNEGITWSKSEVVIDFNNRKYNEAYIKVEARGNKIHLAASACKHGDWSTYEHIYYAYFDGNNWKKIDGTILNLPLTPNNMEMVFNSGSDTSWIWDIALSESGYPVIVFSHKLNSNNHEYWWIGWSGSLWKVHKITDSSYGGLYKGEPAYSGGVYLNHKNPFQVYVAVYESGNFEIKKFETFDKKTWVKVKDITKGSNKWNIRPVVPRNASEELEVLWMSGDYESYIKFNTIINHYPK